MSSSNSVRVYSFHLYDGHAERPAVAAFKATVEAIHRLGGELLAGTEEVVSSSLLDAQGHFARRPEGWLQQA